MTETEYKYPSAPGPKPREKTKDEGKYPSIPGKGWRGAYPTGWPYGWISAKTSGSIGGH